MVEKQENRNNNDLLLLTKFPALNDVVDCVSGAVSVDDWRYTDCLDCEPWAPAAAYSLHPITI